MARRVRVRSLRVGLTANGCGAKEVCPNRRLGFRVSFGCQRGQPGMPLLLIALYFYLSSIDRFGVVPVSKIFVDCV